MSTNATFSYLLMMSNLSSRLNQFHFYLGVSLFDSIFLFNGVDLVKEDWTLEWTLEGDFFKSETRRNIKKWY